MKVPHNLRLLVLFVGAAALILTLLLMASSHNDVPYTTPTVLSGVQRMSATLHPISPTILFVIGTAEQNYATRVTEIRDTWHQRVRSSRSFELLFVGTHNALAGANMVPSTCREGYWEGHCKQADLVSQAYKYLSKLPEAARFEWVLFSDDDVYIFPDNVQRMIHSLGPAAVKERAVWGILGCSHKDCTGICGGGYFTNYRTLVEINEGGDKARYPSLRDETEAFDRECGRYGDLTLSRVIRDNRKIPLKQSPPGSYNWNFKKADEELLQSLKKTDPRPWLYHYPSRNKMSFIHSKSEELGTCPEWLG